jgi:hypothetical protein
VAQEELPLQALRPAHFTGALSASLHRLEHPEANNAAAAAATAKPIFFGEVPFIILTPMVNNKFYLVG